MEKKTKIILGVLAVAGISIYAYNKYSKKESVKKDTDKKSEFLGISTKKNNPIVSKQSGGGTTKCDCESGMKYNNNGWLNPVQNCQCKGSTKS